jgi:hypothetical protein
VSFRGRWVARGAAFLVLGLAFIAVLSFVVMSLWNGLVPGLFHGPTLQFWQAVGLLILCRILFGGFRGRGHGWHGGSWRGHMWRRRWESMTPEERERLRARFKHRCGWDPGAAPEEAPAEQAKP